MLRLDYCNAVLAGIPAATLAPLQRVLNAAARLVLDLKPRDHAIPALRELHWLPMHRITHRVQAVYSSTRHSSVSHQTTFRTCSHLSPTYQHARLQQQQPVSSTDRAAIRRPCVLCRCSPCLESLIYRTETRAVANNNIQASSSEDTSVQLSIHLPLTIWNVPSS